MKSVNKSRDTQNSIRNEPVCNLSPGNWHSGISVGKWPAFTIIFMVVASTGLVTVRWMHGHCLWPWWQPMKISGSCVGLRSKINFRPVKQPSWHNVSSKITRYQVYHLLHYRCTRFTIPQEKQIVNETLCQLNLSIFHLLIQCFE